MTRVERRTSTTSSNEFVCTGEANRRVVEAAVAWWSPARDPRLGPRPHPSGPPAELALLQLIRSVVAR
jgi:hypothetical protein